MKKLLLSALALTSMTLFAQEEETQQVQPQETVTPRWTKGGNASLMFSQSAFNHDWTGGGTNNVAGNLAISYAFNYKKDKWAWDNNIYIDYGLTKLQDDKFTRKTNDRFEINSVLGKQATEFWYYSLFLNFKTQLTDGYKYTATDRTLINKLLSPGYLQSGIGMLWKKSDNLKVNLAPVTAKIVTARKQFTSPTSANYIANFYGVENNKNIRFELGFSANAYAKFNIMDNVSLENILSLYSNYLDKPQNIDIDYTLNAVLTINKYLSTNFTFQAIYDDNAARAVQIREVFGLGVNCKF